MLTASLKAAMTAFAAADAAFQKGVSLDLKAEAENDALWNAEETAEEEMIRHPCRTLEDVRAKAQLAIDDRNVFDSISNCTIAGEHGLYVFLRSLLGELAADPIDESGQSSGFALVDIGEN